MALYRCVGNKGKLVRISLGNQNLTLSKGTHTVSWTAPSNLKSKLSVNNFSDGVTSLSFMAKNNSGNGIDLLGVNYDPSSGIYTRTYKVDNSSLDWINHITAFCLLFYIE